MKEKFTGGEWYINKTGPHWNNPDLTNIEICYSEAGEVICDTVYSEDDAHLMAQSKNMYRMLNDAQEMLDSFHKNTGSLGAKSKSEEIKVLLSKTRGEL